MMKTHNAPGTDEDSQDDAAAGAPGDPGDGPRDGSSAQPPVPPKGRRRRPRATAGTGRLADPAGLPHTAGAGGRRALPDPHGPQGLAVRDEGARPRDRVRPGDRAVRRDWRTSRRSSARPAERFWNAFWNTTFLTFTTVTLETVIGVAMALIMHQAFRGRALVRAGILVPWAVPTAVTGLLWRWIFNSRRRRQRPASGSRSCGRPRASTPRSPSSSPRCGRRHPSSACSCWPASR